MTKISITGLGSTATITRTTSTRLSSVTGIAARAPHLAPATGMVGLGVRYTCEQQQSFGLLLWGSIRNAGEPTRSANR